MSTEANKIVVQRYFEQVNNERRHDLVDELLAENVEMHGTGLPPGTAALKQWLTMFRTAFPDYHFVIEDTFAEADRVATRITTSGTFQGDFRDPVHGQVIPPTGRTFKTPQIVIFRIANGKIAEFWFAADSMEQMLQLGVIPAAQ